MLLWHLGVKRPTRVGRPAHAGSILSVSFIDDRTLLTYERPHSVQGNVTNQFT